jgi:hypothetical protein
MYNFLPSHLLRFSQTHKFSSTFSRKTYFFLKLSKNLHTPTKQRPLSLADKILNTGFEKPEG